MQEQCESANSLIASVTNTNQRVARAQRLYAGLTAERKRTWPFP